MSEWTDEAQPYFPPLKGGSDEVGDAFTMAGEDRNRKLLAANITLKGKVDRLTEQLQNVDRRQADLRREIKLLIADNHRLRDEQPERIALEKKIAKLESSVAQSNHKLLGHQDALEAIYAYTKNKAAQTHESIPACGEGPCILCLIEGTAAEALDVPR